MHLTGYVDDLRRRLETTAEAAGEEARQLVQRLTAPLDAAVRLVLLDALSAAVGEISAELAPGSVDLRLRGGDPQFVVEAAVWAEPAPTGAAGSVGSVPAGLPGPTVDGEDGATTRTTLRLPDHLKAQVEVAAARAGLSVNAWLVRAVVDALEPQSEPPAARGRPGRPGATRVTGWVH